jgi:hypothetical protein
VLLPMGSGGGDDGKTSVEVERRECGAGAAVVELNLLAIGRGGDVGMTSFVEGVVVDDEQLDDDVVMKPLVGRRLYVDDVNAAACLLNERTTTLCVAIIINRRTSSDSVRIR